MDNELLTSDKVHQVIIYIALYSWIESLTERDIQKNAIYIYKKHERMKSETENYP